MHKNPKTTKKRIISKKDESPKYWMSKGEFTNIILNAAWAEGYFAETSKQNHSGERDLALIEKKFGVVYL